ncbi:glycosyltransferase family 2 protein [Marinobacter sp.]|uniref:glycosyltransferase family 2 protein n=1 Tax=Marinobacter sp. TaxID=50741 RepID=UPI002B27A3EF|nr:glycosyltransferase family 2 protein [Marinobacter sp.]
MPKVSVIMPVYNVASFVAQAVQSVLDQSFPDFELLIVDDCSPDNSIAICEAFSDDRIRIVKHTVNRGLAGARNTGIRNAEGKYLAFLDSDDYWDMEKLRLHVQHLDENPHIGISFSRSAFVDEHGAPTRFYQMPKLTDITPEHLFCRNPIGNGSAPVIRKATFDQIGYQSWFEGEPEIRYFDSELRRSEDIECWLRVSLQTGWTIAGIPQPLTYYRLNAGGLSAVLDKQLESWEEVALVTATYAPTFVTKHYPHAKAYQLRYLSRQAIRLRDGRASVDLFRKSMLTSKKPLREEFGRTLTTGVAAYILRMIPTFYRTIERSASLSIGWIQRRRIAQDLAA